MAAPMIRHAGLVRCQRLVTTLESTVVGRSAVFLMLNIRSPLFQPVRGRKDPAKDPVAKSKIYYVRKPTPRDSWETEVLHQKYQLYRTQMRSLRSYFMEELSRGSKENIVDPVLRHLLLESEHQELMEWNNEENGKAKLERDTWISDQYRLKESRAMNQVLQYAESLQKDLENKQTLVEEQKEALANIMTKDSMDECINAALAHVVDYNYAIERDGSRHQHSPE